MPSNLTATRPISRLTLGTAALGMAYGVTNPQVPMADEDAMALLTQAHDAGITCIDTAPAYGAAEARIGRWRRDTGADPVLVTKLPALTAQSGTAAAEAVRQAAEESRRRLGCARLDVYLTHHAGDFTRPDVRQALDELRERDVLGAIGASVYEPAEVFAALRDGEAKAVQIPLNVFDRRMATSGALAACREAGATVFVRSAFLQGTLLADPARLPGHLEPLGDALSRLRALAASASVSLLSLLLAAAGSGAGDVSVVIGVYSTAQLGEIMAADAAPALPDGLLDAAIRLGEALPAECLDPRTWPSQAAPDRG